MKRAIHCGLAGFFWAISSTILISGDFARADEATTDGPSRGQLFSQFVRAPAEAELGVLGTALPLFFRFPLNVREDGIFGIDLSHHNEDNCNCKIDWNIVANQKISFAYLKATQGALFRDNKFDNNWSALGEHPTIMRGAYHFLSAKNDPIDQAKNFLAKVGTIRSKDLPPCLDIEWDVVTVDGEQRDSWSDLPPEDIVDRALKWLDHVEQATGRTPIIYTSFAWWKNRIKEDKTALFHRYHIWIADYSAKGLGEEKPSIMSGKDWKIWQFTEKGILADGIPGNVDANIFKGSLDDFRQTFGVSLASTAPNSTPNISGGTTNNTDASPTLRMPAPGDTPVQAPVRDSNLPAPKDANLPAPNSANPSSGANTPSTKPAATPSNPTSTKSSGSNTNDNGFSVRGGPDVRLE